MSAKLLGFCLAAWGAAGLNGTAAGASADLEKGFVQPPASARPWVYWFPLDGNITSNGITADLEAMARVGIGGVLYMETEQGTPKGPAPFASDAWFALQRHACQEASRLGLEINMNNDAGWCGSGGPWITPELSMQRVVWSETEIAGPAPFDAQLPQPPSEKNYYRDIAVFAYPTPAKKSAIPHVRGKTAESRTEIPLRSAYPEWPPEAVIPRDKVINLTDKLTADGRLAWSAPAGRWTVLRMGHTTTGKDNHPAPIDGRGLECDKLSKEALDVHFEHLMGRLIRENRKLTGEGKALVRTHIDSWETHSQNWTPRFREEFQRLRGYDPLPLLPAMAGRVIGSAEMSERFLWDVRQTICELLMENYAGHMRELARRNGIGLSIEAYGDGPFDDLVFAGHADEPMGEFWSWSRFGAAETCTEMASAAHVYGKPILGAEAFTATDGEKWQGHPGNIKDLGDWAFCEGVNRFVFHRYALQPWADVRPGVSMGPWGLHYERTQTWWEQSRAWHAYLARCQFLLQQGLPVADLCFLMPENAPQSFHSPVKGSLDRTGYNFDGCPPEVVLTRMSVKRGRLTLPDGMSYGMLVLPRTPVMTPQLLSKIAELIRDGATVLGAPPEKSPSLVGYPQCDDQVRKLAKEIWGGEAPPAELTVRPFGKGRVVWGRALLPDAAPEYDSDVRRALASANWIWFNEGSPAQSAPPATRYFRRIVALDAGKKVASARLVATADNSFDGWVNGVKVGHGENFRQAYVMGVGHLLKPGANVIAIAAENTTDAPNPAGLVAALTITFEDKTRAEFFSDGAWESAQKAPDAWKTDSASQAGWSAALALGPMGMGPWGELEEGGESGQDPTPDIALASRALAQLGVQPDFVCEGSPEGSAPRHIHKRIGDKEVYFVANKDGLAHDFVCSFRVDAKRPEFWWPDTGRTETAAAFECAEGRTRVPLRLEPYGSVFVVFRKPIARFDPVVAATRDGATLLPSPAQKSVVVVQKAVYGLPGDPTATRDVTAKVKERIVGGDASFPVADMAKGDDPAFMQVKTLRIEYTANGEPFTASATDGQQILLSQPAAPLAASLRGGADGAVVLEASEAGHYQLRTAAGKTLAADVPAPPPPLALTGAWDLDFPSGGGAPAHVSLPKLISWSEHPDGGVKYFSGTATYRKTFDVPETALGQDRRLYLDLGRVEVMAEVTLNGHALGVLWKKPFVVDVTSAVKAGPNALEVRVVNLWINRLIGDEQLPEDSDRNPDGTLKAWPQWLQDGKPSPTGRTTLTSWRLWKKGDALVDSGLLGPVLLRTTRVVKADK